MWTRRVALTVYPSKILSYFDYSALFHYAARLPLVRKLQVLQNRVKVYFLLNTIYHLITCTDPSYNDNRKLHTRAHAGPMFRIPSRCSHVFMKSFAYQGMLSWNRLPAHVRCTGSYELFKRKIKQMIREQEAAQYDGWSMVSMVSLHN